MVFHEVGPSDQQICDQLGMTRVELLHAVSGSSAFLFDKVMLPHLESSTRQLLAAANGAAAIVGGTFAAGATIVADKLALPFVSVALQPLAVLSAYDPPVLPGVPFLTPAAGGPRLWLNRAMLGLAQRRLRRWAGHANLVRAALDLPPTALNPFLFAGRKGALGIGLFSPVLSPRQPDAPANFDVVGYAPYDSEGGGQAALAVELADFLAAGPPPIVFTLGSFAVEAPGDFYRHSVQAAQALGRRAVLLVGPRGDLSVADGAPGAIAVRYAPFSLLFPRAAAIVHQGGVGTTQQALRAGKPQLVVPHLGDQYDNAARIARLGVGAAISRGDYAAARVAQVLRRLLDEPAAAQRAAEIGAVAAQEDGAAAAAERIEQLLKVR
jgi:UDP:flavonoid glycosyltransferase YjiC (YdhE family)